MYLFKITNQSVNKAARVPRLAWQIKDSMAAQSVSVAQAIEVYLNTFKES